MKGNQMKTVIAIIALLWSVIAVASDFVTTASGPNTNLNLSVQITPSVGAGNPGQFFVATLTPGGQLFFLTPAGWQSWSGGTVPPYSSGNLVQTTIPILTNANVWAFATTKIYAGYGTNFAGMAAANTYAQVYTVACPPPSVWDGVIGACVNPPSLVADIPIPGFSGANVAGSFDLVYVDQANHQAYFTDRNNKSVDQLIYNNVVPRLGAQYSAGLGFTGCQSAVGVPAPGCPTAAPAAATAVSGPNGLHGVVGTTTVTAGDVQKIVVFNSANGALIATVPATNPILGNTGFRTDEGCILPATRSPIAGVAIAAYSNTSEAPKTVGAASRGMTFYTFVRLDTNAVIGQLVIPNSSGQELCLFDTTGTAAIMYYTDDGDVANPHSIIGAGNTNPGSYNPDGNLDALHIPNLVAAFDAAPTSALNGNKYIILDTTANVTADIAAGFYAAGAKGAGANLAAIDYKTTAATGFWHRAAGFNTAQGAAPGNGCAPAGMALNTTNNVDVATSCRPALGLPSVLLVVDRNTGAMVAQPLAGNADQVQFDAVGNQYLAASSRWTASARSPGGCAASPATRVCTPVLNIVDATTFAIKARVSTGNNAHGMDFDSSMGLAFLPYSNSTLPAGCGDCAVNGFVNGGVSVIQFR
jgi:hypothetical protein